MFYSLIEKFKIYGFKRFFIYSFERLKDYLKKYLRGSYSQQGEDLVIDKLLNYKKKGFYVDVGANDPDHFSNTKRFYMRGWDGINIEPDIKNHSKFIRLRKRDINLNIGVAAKSGNMIFYKFFPGTLSTFSDYSANDFVKQGFLLKEKIEVSVKPLSEVLDRYCPGKAIDFMSVDTEGFDLEVLQSNDWIKFTPRLICVESVNHTVDGVNNERDSSCQEFLERKGYRRVFSNGLNSIFKFQYEKI